MITQLRNLLTLAVCLFTAGTVQAQFVGGVEQQEGRFWKEMAVTFKLSEVAATLGTDTETLATAFSTWQNGEGGEDMLFLVNPTDQTLINDYTCDGKGFFMTTAGALAHWGDDGTWYTYGNVDANNDAFSFIVAQSDALSADNSPLKEGDVASANLVLKFNGKQATFVFTLTVTSPAAAVDIPEPATVLWQQVNIVGEQEVTVEQKPRAGYDADLVEVDVADMAEKLGVDIEILSDNLAKLLYAKRVALNDDYYYLLSDSLTIDYTANAPGYWFHAVQDAEGQETGEVAALGYQADDKFYAEGFALDAETGKLSFNLGQYPNVLLGGEQLYAYVYIMYGDKTYRVRINLNIQEVQLGTLEDYEKAGETTIELEMGAKTDGDYSTKDFDVDIEGIAAALGCDIGDIEFYALADDINFAEKNQEGVGYWFDMDGYVINWGASAMVYLTPKANDLSRFGLGQYPDHLSVGNELSVSIYFLGNGKYYKLTVHLTVIPETVYEDEFIEMARRTLVFQQVPAAYTWHEGYDIPQQWIEENIGTADWVLYGQNQLDEEGNELAGNDKYTKTYTMGEKPGFWFDKDGRKIAWGAGQSVFGMTAGGYTQGKIQMIQMDGDACQVGDVFNAKVFFVNESNGHMVTVNLVYQIVEQVKEYETVGTETVTLPVATDQEQMLVFDLSKAAVALNIPTDNLFEGEYLHGITEDGIYGQARACEDGIAFNKNGFYDFEDGLVELRFEKQGNEVKAITYGLGEIASDFSLRTQFCFEVGDKRYVYEVHFVSEAIYAGIQNVNTTCNDNKNVVYDLNGRKVSRMAHGVYIMNGRKVVR